MGTRTDNAGENVKCGEDNKDVAEKEDQDLDLESFGNKKKKVVDFDEEKGAEDAGEKETAGDGKSLLRILNAVVFHFDCNYLCLLYLIIVI